MTPTAAGSIAIPEAQTRQGATPIAELDAALEALQEVAPQWPKVSVAERIVLLRRMVRDSGEVCDEWARLGCEAKGGRPGGPEEADEWAGGPLCWLRNLRLLIRALEDIERDGRPKIPGKVYTRPDGQVVAQVMPVDAYDRVLYGGFSAEVWMQPDVTLSELPGTQAEIYNQPPGEGEVSLVLGAGNVSSIGAQDALYKLFVEDKVCVVKMNPVNDYLGPIYAKIMAPLVERGFVKIVYGGAEQGIHLCNHALVDEIHITGSDKTHDAIVYGGGEEGAKRKAARTPVNNKPISSELGNVSPIIVVPGPWTDADMQFQAANLATQLVNNGGFNCNAARVILQHASWDRRQPLLEELKKVFQQVPTRRAYYPGAADRWDAFVQAHPDAWTAGEPVEGRLPWTLITGVDPGTEGDICFNTEAFCAVCAETGIEAPNPAAYIDKAVEMCNERIWGSLNAEIIVHPQSLRDPAVAAAVERAIAELRYGTVAVNHWPALAYAFGTTTWGAFPGHELHDIQSGIGVVHNSLMFSKVQKTVVRGPFRVRPLPPWFVTHKGSLGVLKKLAKFEQQPSITRLPGVVAASLKG